MEFYKKLLQEETIYANDERWVQYSNKIALYNKDYDTQIIVKEPSSRFNQAYIVYFYRDTGTPKIILLLQKVMLWKLQENMNYKKWTPVMLVEKNDWRSKMFRLGVIEESIKR